MPRRIKPHSAFKKKITLKLVKLMSNIKISDCVLDSTWLFINRVRPESSAGGMVSA